jgi:hypothetical protein
MKTQALKEFLSESDKTAEDLLNEVNPKLKAKFQRALKSLDSIIDELREFYPDASYYVDDDEVNLMLGHSHITFWSSTRKNRELVADCARKGLLVGKIGGGGW